MIGVIWSIITRTITIFRTDRTMSVASKAIRGLPALHGLAAGCGRNGLAETQRDVRDVRRTERLALREQHRADPAVVANLRKAKFLIVHSWDATHPLCDVADVLLPSTIHAEKEGTFTNLQEREQQIFQAYPPKGQAVGDDEIFRRVLNSIPKAAAAAAGA